MAPSNLETEFLVCSDAGANGKRNLPSGSMIDNVEAKALKPDSNTTMMWRRALIPIINVHPRSISNRLEATFAMGVLLQDLETVYEAINIDTKWKDVPIVSRSRIVCKDQQYILVT
jgi:hypothetical protein